MFEKISLFSAGARDGAAIMFTASGAALVSMYDKSTSGVNRLRAKLVPNEKNALEHSIRQTITKIHALQYEIGRARARQHPEGSADDLELQARVCRLQDCENTLATMKKRVTEIEQEKKAIKAGKQATVQNQDTVHRDATAPPVDMSAVVSTEVCESAAVSATAADENDETPAVSERHDSVRVIGRRAKKEPSCGESSDDMESMAA